MREHEFLKSSGQYCQAVWIKNDKKLRSVGYDMMTVEGLVRTPQTLAE